jgi:hypothetical protein
MQTDGRHRQHASALIFGSKIRLFRSFRMMWVADAFQILWGCTLALLLIAQYQNAMIK